MTTAITNTANTSAVQVIFSINEELVPQALEGLSHDELWRAPSSHNNAMLWVAGHVAQTRALVLQMLGQPLDTGWGNLFDRGAKVGRPSDYPSGPEIVDKMRAINPRLREALSALTSEQLAQPASLGIPGLNNLGDELAFFALHESYHVGQLAYIRKSLGYAGMVG